LQHRIYPRERCAPPVRVNAELAVDEPIARNDDFADAVNYEPWSPASRKSPRPAHHLVETLADRVATLCLTDRRVSAVRV